MGVGEVVSMPLPHFTAQNEYRQIQDWRVRAIRRCGELLKQFDGRGGNQTESKVALTSAPTQREAAESAGMSLHQQRTAVRVANIPAETFETHVESEAPARAIFSPSESLVLR